MSLFNHFNFIHMFIFIMIFNFSQCQSKPLNVNRVKYLRQNNFTQVLSPYKLAIVNFYADSCTFCHQFKPVLEETAAIVDIQYPGDNEVVVAQLNCDEEPGIRDFFHITKYPTVKIIRNGLATRSEYRSQRTTEALVNFIAEELKDPMMKVEDAPQLDVQGKSLILGRFDSKDSPDYYLFSRVCYMFNHFGVCKCFARFGHAGPSALTLQTEDAMESYAGGFDRDNLVQWFTGKCIPLVREITYNNAEEISEAGTPLLILCHRHEDTTSVAVFNKLVRHVAQYSQNLTFVTADDLLYENIFQHHLQLTSDDLPVLRLDDYKHIYPLPSLTSLAQNPDILVTILEDYLSGKLHVDYHDGNTVPCDKDNSHNIRGHPTVNVRDVFPIYEVETQSIFRNLTPSKLRYTLLNKVEL